MNDIRITINEEQFAKLVRGEIVEVFPQAGRDGVTVKLALSDIGFINMLDIVQDEWRKRQR